MAEPLSFLGLDIGASKTAWGTFNDRGTLVESGEQPTPKEKEAFLFELSKLIKDHLPQGLGIGIAATLSPEGELRVCTNMPFLNYFPLADFLKEEGLEIPFVIDNDARCALIGEVWKGAAKDERNCVMLTLGTGVGGAVMQKGMVQHHPDDVQNELGRLMVDPQNPYPGTTGPGTLEALLGGRSIEGRFGEKIEVLAEKGHAGDPEALEIWKTISYYFLQSMRAIHATYGCNTIIIGGHGVRQLDLYMGTHEFPCPIIPSKLETLANVYGAVRIGMDAYEEDQKDWE